ncbi:translation initiation factor IF-2 [Paenactinomyces guangxiensis]|uniref:Translation initiation factor IF-2 n=1 Tax=Paenactinomyces guangxiensis TaxID=1490290 RepID=A0A7W2A8P2_9BACL|nr:translation initiation factor IF-2 [Paenactinomyces guangxiensis]MBA4494372.1 translation initiation factor IF-2 [Paenactinomyces guangxiensis]MBH8591573.1 translation initiation factor IF-2 [Paenactinomyces guangxiensis]
MSKMRVYEYAKQMNMSSKEVLTILERMDLKVNNHMSVMDEGMIQKVEQFISKVKQGGSTAGTNQQEKPQGERKTRNNKPNQQHSGNRNQNKSNKPQAANSKGPRPNRANNNQNNAKAKPARQRQTEEKRKLATDSGTYDNPKGRKSDHKKGKFTKFKDDSSKESGSFRGGKGRSKKKGDKKAAPREKQAPVLPKEITVSGPLTVGEFAKLLRKEASEVIRKLISLGIMATINQEIDVDTMSVIAEEFGVTVEYKEEVDESNFEEQEENDDPEALVERPPVVTIMGHVDHGKTTLLDKIRHTNVTAGEAGGITQHIGAYQVEINNKKITFLDTPGHAAFTTMRARGAKVTDITILVVAADDGVKPQTVEAINHAKAADVPIIVAVNKMDKPEANPDRVKQQLTEHGLVPEEWGGETIFVPVSAITGAGIDELLEMVLLVAEVQELKANPDKRARGVVIEAELDKGRGAVATVLVQNGTLKVGDGVVAGNYFGKIRAMVNDRGRRVKVAPPSTPVEILGLSDVPGAGDPFMVFEDEKKGRAIAERRMAKQKEEERGGNKRVTLDDLFKQIQEGEMKELNVIIKADVHGSAEAMKNSLEKIDVEGARVKIIHTGVGAITEYDVILASASNAIIVGFNVRPEPNARAVADQEKVDIRLHRIIYKAIEEIEAAMKGLLDPEYEEKVVGTAEVRQTFKVSKVGTIAGCYVTEGKVVRDGHVRLIRDGIVIHEGKLDTLKRFKDDAKEVAQGYECGITLENYNDIKEGDVIEVYVIEEVERA